MGESRDAWNDFLILKNEMLQYNSELDDRPSIILANKMDIPGAEENLERFLDHLGESDWAHIKVFQGSAKDAHNLEPMILHMRKMILNTKKNVEVRKHNRDANIKAVDITGEKQKQWDYFEPDTTEK
eukprot:TRINITY_DN4721_c0_g1_i2.p2 TRINITY_DN4721_c0_g1~~TRINITY_DN4721_c0_g1_i2.p2  ORF type:complete len:127 (+),score=37.54 TRINITY_DN4721_c0_g1_i2:275-655(+)